uniref:Uncharacterized protein n=1 Tax=Panagrolaimus davidi TaxID=227884 RepID=A0A914Q319_9BILA
MQFKASQKLLDSERPSSSQQSGQPQMAPGYDAINFHDVDIHFYTYEETKAYQQLISIKNDSNKDDVGLNWRIGHACYILASCSKNEKRRRVLLLEGYEHIRNAYEKAPTDENVLLWAPIITCSLSANANGHKERIKYGHEFKKYVDEAIQQFPEDFTFYHISVADSVLKLPLGSDKEARRWLSKTSKSEGTHFIDNEQIQEARKLLAKMGRRRR